MAGFIAGIGGAGAAAHDYGQQIRGLLEQRRNHFAELLTTLASQELDPEKKATYLQGVVDLHRNKPMEKALL